MPRITPLRLLFLPPLCWLALAVLWVALPSPQNPWRHDPSGHRWNGGTLTRVYDVDDWWSSTEVNHLAYSVMAVGRNSFALDYHYDADTGTLSIGYQYPSPMAAYKLSPSSEPFVSAPFAAYARLGDQDGINMPWFPRADATLLFWQIHLDTRKIPLRLQVKRSTVANEFDVFVWAHSGEMDSDFVGIAKTEADATWEAAGWQSPLLGMHFVFEGNLDQSTGRQTPAIQVQFPAAISSWSPSLTFPVRRAIGNVIVPTGEIVLELLSLTAGTLRVFVILLLGLANVFIYTLGLYVLLVLACWASKHFPPFWPWAHSFWLTRRVVRVLGPATSTLVDDSKSGNADNDHGDETESGDSEGAPRGPRPLTSVWAFFTSKSPLDDLLVTFETTRPFVQPLSLVWRRPTPIDEEQPPAASSGVGSHVNADNTRSRNASIHETKTGLHENDEKV